MKVHAGQLAASGTLSGSKPALDFLDLPSMKLLQRSPLGNTDRNQPLTREGMTIFENNLWLLPEDSDSRLFVFDLAMVKGRR